MPLQRGHAGGGEGESSPLLMQKTLLVSLLHHSGGVGGRHSPALTHTSPPAQPLAPQGSWKPAKEHPCCGPNQQFHPQNCSPRLQVSPGERPTPFINSQQDNDSKARSIPHSRSSHRSPGPIPHLQPRAGPGQDKGCPWVRLARAGRAQGDPQPHGAAPTPLLWGLQQHQDLTQPWDLAGEAAPRAKAVTHDLKN